MAEFLLQKRRRKLTDSGVGNFEAVDFNYQKLADFGAGISDAKKHKIQEVLEELDVNSLPITFLCLNYFKQYGIPFLVSFSYWFQVHKRLNLTLELVKKQVEMNKIQLFHASLFPVTHATCFFFFVDVMFL